MSSPDLLRSPEELGFPALGAFCQAHRLTPATVLRYILPRAGIGLSSVLQVSSDMGRQPEQQSLIARLIAEPNLFPPPGSVDLAVTPIGQEVILRAIQSDENLLPKRSPSFGAWLNTFQAAGVLGLSYQRIYQLADKIRRPEFAQVAGLLNLNSRIKFFTGEFNLGIERRDGLLLLEQMKNLKGHALDLLQALLSQGHPIKDPILELGFWRVLNVRDLSILTGKPLLKTYAWINSLAGANVQHIQQTYFTNVSDEALLDPSKLELEIDEQTAVRARYETVQLPITQTPSASLPQEPLEPARHKPKARTRVPKPENKDKLEDTNGTDEPPLPLEVSEQADESPDIADFLKVIQSILDKPIK